MSHIQFNKQTRIELGALLLSGKNYSYCAVYFGMHRSSVGSEVSRNKDSDGVYRGVHAHKKYLARRKESKVVYRKIQKGSVLHTYIVDRLHKDWSPEQIAGRLLYDAHSTSVCAETIYTHIYRIQPELIIYLRRQKSKYRRRRGTKARTMYAKSLKMRTFSERPEIVNTRSRIGDWEGDTVIGKEKTQRIITYVERKSGYALATKIEIVTAESVERLTEKLFNRVPKEKKLTLTRDNGTEFGDFDMDLELATGMKVYRATPYHSWERGTNENWNGLLRQYFPKGSYFATIQEYDIQKVVTVLNNRPRKRLGYRTPQEVFCCDSG